ncbi:unnamed protein product [Chironomus riparius]|uniref:RAP domain-containing protein n=1 Tax=Chironomus riparius TaxID=315576 RepID=A0A9N9WQV5_9DIPT|nr:unnamed protein product [Chironomus riparius]
MLGRIVRSKYCNFMLSLRSINNATVIFNKDFNESSSEVGTSTNLVIKSLQTVNVLPDLIQNLSNVHKNDIEPEQLTKIFSKIFELYKNDFEQNSLDIIKTTGFKNCCAILKSHAPRMVTNDLVICLKTLVSLNLNSKHKIVQQLLYHIKEEINELSLSQLAFLNYLLLKMESTPLVNALKIALPIVFDLNVSLKLNHENPEEIMKLLHYVSVTELKISDKSMMNLLSSITLHGTSISVHNAQTVLSAVRKLSYRYYEDYDVVQKLVQNCIHVLNIKFEESTFPKMEATLEKLIRKYKYSGIDEFYNETFYNNCAKQLIEKDLGFTTAYHVLKKFNEVNFVNYELLNYIDKQIIQNHTLLSTMHLNQVMNLVAAFSTADYKSENWEIIKSILHENPALHNDITKGLPHLKFICELLSLDFVSKIYFDKVLNETFLFDFLKQNLSKNFANLPQIRIIYQTLKLLYPKYDGIIPDEMLLNIANDAIPTETTGMNEVTKDMMQKIFGTGTAQMNVQSKYGHLIDFVISFDTQNKAISLPCKVQLFDDIPKSQVRSVAVFFHSRKNCPLNFPIKLRGIISLRRKTMEAMGIKVVDIPLHCLDQIPESEKLEYVEREIRYGLE